VAVGIRQGKVQKENTESATAAGCWEKARVSKFHPCYQKQRAYSQNSQGMMPPVP
jgi:hypothetical protein